MKTLTLVLFSIVSNFSYAFESYYPQKSLDILLNEKTTSTEIQNELFNILNKVHIINEHGEDELTDSCPIDKKCYSQSENVTYKMARIELFGSLHLEKNKEGYFLKDLYCNQTITENEGVGPGLIPDSNIMNCEHTWPQSKFTTEFPNSLQKSDLHHLFPVNTRANSTRSNLPFAEVNGRVVNNNCTDSKQGNAIGTKIKSFEPPTEHRGNVARALFYFSTRYKMTIDETEKKYLKKWHSEDPVDETERVRNEKIMNYQGNRNPYIDFPELVERI